MRTRSLVAVFVALAGTLTGCLTGGAQHIELAPASWTREDLLTHSWTKCGMGECRNTLRTSRGPISVATRVREYGLHDIPGWNGGSTVGRVAGGILGGIMRRQGMSTEHVTIRHGTQVLSDSGATPWRLRCSVYTIDDETEEYNKSENDHVTRRVRRASGADCRAYDMADTAAVLWHFQSGIAPSRDSLAVQYDSLARDNPPMVSATPPISLERLAADGAVAARYEVTRRAPGTLMEQLAELHQITIAREGGAPIATIYQASGTTADFAPDATIEETRIVRLIAALLAAESR